ncbi:Fe-S cluster assembly protein SufD [soil metagenome]
MTGSSSNVTPVNDVSHATSPQWEALVEAATRAETQMRDQTETWWSAQANRLASEWLSTGLPTTRMEAWKYTSLVGLHAKARKVGLGPVDVKAPAGVKVFRLSQMASEESLTGADRAGIRELLETKSDVFFENLAKSLVVDPFIVAIPPSFTSDAPIEITWKSLPADQWGLGLAIVFVGEKAQVKILESYGAGVDAQTVATIVEVRDHAVVHHLRVQAGDNKADVGFILASSRARVWNHSRYEASQVSFGSKLSREDLTVELCAADAGAVTDGVFIGRSNQLLDHHTNLVHRVGSTTSRQIYKGILADEARGVFNGRIAIERNASGSDSSQMNKNLLLSKRVEIDTKPQLEIDNDDVKAAHGAAIGRLDADHIFYLRSRGISMSQSVEMLARGFAYEAVHRLSSPALRALGTREIDRGLKGLSWEAL